MNEGSRKDKGKPDEYIKISSTMCVLTLLDTGISFQFSNTDMTNRALSLREAQYIRELRVSKNDCGQRDHYRTDNFMVCMGILAVDIIIPIDPF